MKNFITICLMLLFTISIVNAQIRRDIKLPKKTPITKYDLNNNLDLEKIKNHIKSNKFCYTVNVSSTAIFAPKYPNPVKAVDAYYTSTKYLKVERSYLRTNGLLLRSDKTFNRSQGNNYEVLIYPDRRNPKLVNKNQVKLTWRIPESQLRTFNLKNVSVQYKPHGILITGNYEVDGIVFGVSIALVPTTCLI
ncbi:hypothetical protein [Spongiivirga citrea]|uniref:Uncharacterized protein n=1 Tax=Spongiivirga citrea TaxID=1481457 RepID=A0A6M0CT55_9FLAO|nr:hypothetical protein [Spongiivirga citrea]NER18697.1 hypothetical protein [Spongiivirga citrea]